MANTLYPLKFKPIFKDKIWGGQRIKTKLGLDFGKLPNCGEVWVVSGEKNNPSVLENGFLAGNELNELVEIYMGDLVGEKHFKKFGNEFPLLVKYIDANDWLSIQVHPNDKLAAKRKIGWGKTEMWYIIHADEGAQLISGFNRKVDKETYLKHLESNTLPEILNYEDAHTGDVFFIPAGRVHALGPGILLAEIQQTSDTTYRIYDWDRIDHRGMKRELHTEEALDAIDFNFYDDYKTHYKLIKNLSSTLVNCDKFTTNLIKFDQPVMKDISGLDSFIIYMGLEGKVILKSEEGEMPVKPGDAIVIPAVMENLNLKPEGEAKLLEIYIQ
ncbi:MAG: mannose-6-phosphate isomerase [Chlorobi bacterium]|nr:mannose-6-phosphate isomerase [Chlorobiota bacterium]